MPLPSPSPLSLRPRTKTPPRITCREVTVRKPWLGHDYFGEDARSATDGARDSQSDDVYLLLVSPDVTNRNHETQILPLFVYIGDG